MSSSLKKQKKALTLAPFGSGSNVGGPPGFIATNYRNKTVRNCDFAFLEDFPTKRKNPAHALLSRIGLRFIKLLKSGLLGNRPQDDLPWINTIGNNAHRLYKLSHAEDYRAVIFHDEMSLYFCLPLIPQGQVVVLYPHMPELLHEEIVSFGAGPESRVVFWAKNEVTPKCFSRADVVILPNKGVLDIYKPVVNPKAKVYFVASGSSTVDVKEALPLDPSLTKFLYIGRRQAIKGFDIILEAFLDAYSENQKIRLFIAGNGPVCDLPGVIDLQSTMRPHLWMKSVDCVVNANRQSFFDRSLIEALCVGAPLLLACTHGHAELEDASPGIYSIRSLNVDNLKAAFLHIASHGFPKEARQANQNLYRSRYSDECHRNQLEATLEFILR